MAFGAVGAFAAAVAVTLAGRRLRGRTLLRSDVHASGARRRVDWSVRPAKRTTHVSDDEWRAFREVKASIVGERGERAVALVLARLGVPVLHDVILADSRGLTQVDHLVLGRDGIHVIETKTYSGLISGTPSDAVWTQHLGDGTVRSGFQNPLRQNYRHCAAVLDILRGLSVPVRSYVVSAGPAVFSDTLAASIVPVGLLPSMFEASAPAGVSGGALCVAWERLVHAARAGEARRAEHARIVGGGCGYAA